MFPDLVEILQYIFEMVDDQRTLAMLPLVSRRCWNACTLVKATFSFANFPERVQHDIIHAKKDSKLLFLVFQNTAVLRLCTFYVINAEKLAAIVQHFANVRVLDLRSCHALNTAEWDKVLDALQGRNQGALQHLEKVWTPWCRLHTDSLDSK